MINVPMIMEKERSMMKNVENLFNISFPIGNNCKLLDHSKIGYSPIFVFLDI